MSKIENEKQEVDATQEESPLETPCMSRRKLLMTGGKVGGLAAISMLLPGTMFPGKAAAGQGMVSAAVAARTIRYPRTKVGKLSALKTDRPVKIRYPGNAEGHKGLLIKLGEKAMGGVGSQQDVVAFSAFCTHQGGPLEDQYNPKEKSLGPCEFHLSRFDLTKHGIMITASAVQNLPQIVLEVEGDDIYAVGVLGLIYGYQDNLQGV
ncbi:MAG: arsenate reductase (azurin) small subunit [Nitrospinaceae bacterium]|jgi:arsenite oxidase small subunit|nr:arsenate reductase (azurin) small subunit [Nitrospinaceae bacterium]